MQEKAGYDLFRTKRTFATLLQHVAEMEVRESEDQGDGETIWQGYECAEATEEDGVKCDCEIRDLVDAVL